MMRVCLIVLAVFLGVAVADHHRNKLYARRNLHKLMKREWWCLEEGHTCPLVLPCCDGLWCVQLAGDVMGTCSTCQNQNQECQLDNHCCAGLQCDKEGDLQFDGHCLPPRENGQQCWENSQCQSGNCDDNDFYPDSGECVPAEP